MQTLFSEIFAKDDWLKLWDHLITNQPSFMYYMVVAYLIRFRSPLLATHREADFEYFFQRRNAVRVNSVILLAYKLAESTPSSLSSASFVAPFTPCLQGEYPMFNKYPEFIVNYQSKMKDKIRKEEDEYIRKRRTVEELTRLTEELKKDKSAWDSADWKMNDMIEQWWDQMIGTFYINVGQEKKVRARKEHFKLTEREEKAAALDTIAQGSL